MRIGVFGGTFDPVHLGHLILAEQCREQGRLDEVWFIPSARPPHKLDRYLTPFPQRAEMLALAVAGHPAFRIDEIEMDRPGPSFTADTLAELLDRHPGAELLLLLGSDTLPDLPLWHNPQEVVRRAGLLVVMRPGHPLLPEAELRARLQLPEGTPLWMQAVEAPLIDIASRDLRRRAAEGRSLRYLVPRAVECYIQDKHLYRGT
jgi:nicotinate-nucleotide adenylyltransferase